VEALRPIQEKYQQLMSEQGYLDSILKEGQEKASAIAQQTLSRVKNALGYLPPF
jgi:tryptophanyl-tRNA synthetase